MMYISTILLVEDNLFSSRIIKKFFEQRGSVVYQAFDIGSAFQFASQHTIDLVILDLKLPAGLSYYWIEELKGLVNAPVLVYTASNNVGNELTSLKKGAEDYVLKTRGVEILYQRALRLITASTFVDTVDSSNLDRKAMIIELGNGWLYAREPRVLYKDDFKIKLTSNESKVFLCLSHQVGKLVNKDQLSLVVKGASYDGWSRSLDLLMFRLRKKLMKDSKNMIDVETVRGKGYILVFN